VEVLILITTKFKKLIIVFFVFITIIQLVACKQSATENIIESTSVTPTAQVNNSHFIHSSLQDGAVQIVSDKVLTNVCLAIPGIVFSNNPKNDKYEFQNYINDYLEFDKEDSFGVKKIFKNNNKIIYVDRNKIVIEDISTKQNTIIDSVNICSNSIYLKDNKIYFDEYDELINYYYKYSIKYVDLEKKEIVSVFTYDSSEGIKDLKRFVLREDGAIAFVISFDKDISKLITYKNGTFNEIMSNKLINLVDYDMKGLYITKPALSNKEIENFGKELYKIKKFDFILKNEDGKEDILLSRNDLDYSNLKVFDNFFVNIDVNVYGYKSIEKIDFNGKVIKKINLKQWPDLGKTQFHDEKVVYYEGKLLNVFCRNDTRELEIETININ
jgi:hypothetical protein